MKIRLLLSFIVVVVVISARPARADDIQLWTGAGASLLPVEPLELAFEPEVRFDENVSRFAAVLMPIKVRYRIVKWLRVGVGYRAEYERDNDGELVWRHRINADVSPRLDVGPVRLGYRLRLQEQFRPTSKDKERATLRNRLEVSYQGFEQLAPALSAELFHQMGDFDVFQLSKVRLTGGTSYNFWEEHEIELFYSAELLMDDEEDTVRHIFGLTYHYDIHL